jgi:tetratricopeptide (TPR) repeat protein
MKTILVIFIVFFTCFVAFENIQSQEIDENNLIRDAILVDNFAYRYLGELISDEYTRRDSQSQVLYSEFLELYHNRKYEAAITKIEDIIQLFPHGVYYYYYGNCFLETGNYEYAEKAYLSALRMFNWFFNPWYQTSYGGGPRVKDIRYSFDHNGAPREGYFAYYNLACTYSLVNKYDFAFDYLKGALEYGFPFIDHLYNDPDLQNLFNSSNEIKNEIEKIYEDGFVNTFSGKAYYYGRASESDEWFFVDNENVYNTKYMYVRFGKYEIKNNLVIIYYYYEEGNTGVNYIPGGGVQGAYEYYEQYENEIKESEIINIKDFSEIWKEIPFKPKDAHIQKINPNYLKVVEQHFITPENTEYSIIPDITVDDYALELGLVSNNKDHNKSNYLWLIVCGIVVIVGGVILIVLIRKKKK